jgi:hypothetical protein
MTDFCVWNIIVAEKYLIFCQLLFVTERECESVCEIDSDEKETFMVFRCVVEGPGFLGYDDVVLGAWLPMF